MMSNNPCFRCGKQRIVVETNKEMINGSIVTTTITACPDADCQTILDKQMEKEKATRDRFVGLSKNPANSFGRQGKGIVLGKKKKVS